MLARFLVAFTVLTACRTPAPDAVRPTVATRDDGSPIAERHAHAVTSEHGTREDPYYWLRDDTRKDPAVLAYLAAENAYAAKLLAPAKSLEAKLVAEMSARVD